MNPQYMGKSISDSVTKINKELCWYLVYKEKNEEEDIIEGNYLEIAHIRIQMKFPYNEVNASLSLSPSFPSETKKRSWSFRLNKTTSILLKEVLFMAVSILRSDETIRKEIKKKEEQIKKVNSILGNEDIMDITSQLEHLSLNKQKRRPKIPIILQLQNCINNQ